MQKPIKVIVASCLMAVAGFVYNGYGPGAAPPERLVMAAEAGDVEQLRILLQGHVDLSADVNDWTALQAAAAGGHAAAVKTLLERGAAVDQPNSAGFTAIHRAALTGNAETVAALIAGGASVNARTYPGTTPLMAAAITGDVERVRLLLEAGADVDAKSGTGATALSIAKDGEHIGLVMVLEAWPRKR